MSTALRPGTAPTTAALRIAAVVERQRRLGRGREGAVRTLQVFAVTLMIFPSDLVLKPVGAAGYVSSLVAMLAFLAFGASCLLGFHDPVRHRSPVRMVLALAWVSTLASYLAMNLEQRDPLEQLAADRWLMQLIGVSGVILVAGGMLRGLEDVRRFQKVLVIGGAICGFVAAVQFWLSIDLTVVPRLLPGFSVNGEVTGIQNRAGLNRVSGTAIHPIELGAVSAMLLPLALNLAIYGKARTQVRRWLPTLLILSCIATSVSRSAILTCVAALGVYLLLLPPAKRVIAFAMSPLAVVGAFMAIPGLISTLRDFFAAGTSDPSISTRVDDYSFVAERVAERPWLGQGGGSFIPVDMLQILDNQYLKTAIEQGIVGVVALVLFLLVPVLAALTARRALRSEEARSLCAGLAGAGLAAAVGAFTFDAWSFPMFMGVHACILGMVAAMWGQAVREDLELMRGYPPATLRDEVH